MMHWLAAFDWVRVKVRVRVDIRGGYTLVKDTGR